MTPVHNWKTKEEQLKDYENILSSRADINCPTCWGRAFKAWNETEERYVPCECLIKNVEKEVAEMNLSEFKKQGVLSKFREIMGVN